MQMMTDTQSGQTAVLHLSGQLDLLTAANVRKELADTVAAGHPRLVVDLAEVSFIDSTGLSSLISGLKAARLAGGDLRVARPSKQVRMLLQLTALERILHPYDSVEEALSGY